MATIKDFIRRIRDQVVFRNMMYLFLLQLISYVFPFVTLPILTRCLGIFEFGNYVWILSIIAIAGVVTDYGFNLSATYYVAGNQKNINYLNSLLSKVFFTKIVLSIFVVLPIAFYLYLSPRATQWLNTIQFILVLLVMWSQSINFSWFFQGMETMKPITVAALLSKGVYVVLVTILIPIFPYASTALLCLFVTNMMLGMAHIILIYKKGFKLIPVRAVEVIFELKSGFGIFFSRIAVMGYSSFNIVLLGMFAGAHQTAMYGAANRLYVGAMNAVGPITQALYPHTTKTKSLRLLMKITFLSMIPLSVVCIVVAWYSLPVVQFILGKNFADSAPLLSAFMGLILLSFISVNFGYPAFAAIGNLAWANRSVYLGSAFHLCGLCALLLTEKFTAQNVLWLLFVTEFIVSTVRLSVLYSYKRREIHD